VKKTIIVDISTIKLLFLAADVIWGSSHNGNEDGIRVRCWILHVVTCDILAHLEPVLLSWACFG